MDVPRYSRQLSFDELLKVYEELHDLQWHHTEDGSEVITHLANLLDKKEADAHGDAKAVTPPWTS